MFAILFQLLIDVLTGALVFRCTKLAWVYRSKYPVLVYAAISFCIIYFVAIGTRWGTGYYLKKRIGDKTDDGPKRRKND